MNCIFYTISEIIFNFIGPNNTALGIHMPNTPMISTGQIIAADIGNIICPPRPVSFGTIFHQVLFNFFKGSHDCL